LNTEEDSHFAYVKEKRDKTTLMTEREKRQGLLPSGKHVTEAG